MAHFSVLPSGKHRAHINKRGSRATATFRTKREAKNWAAAIERELDAQHQAAARFKDFRIDKTPAYFGSGVYFLYRDAEVVYVGKSVKVFSRITSHASNGRPFTHYGVIPCPIKDLDRLEREYIDQLKPVQNKT